MTEPEDEKTTPQAHVQTSFFEAPALWACALVNGDLSGLDYYGPDCVAEFEAWVRANPGKNVVDCSDEPHIGRWNGLQTELLTYTELVECPHVRLSDLAADPSTSVRGELTPDYCESCDGTCEPMCAWCHRQADIAAQQRT